jgi:hypothetical protein
MLASTALDIEVLQVFKDFFLHVLGLRTGFSKVDFNHIRIFVGVATDTPRFRDSIWEEV